MFTPDFSAEYSDEEQLLMARVLIKVQIRNFSNLLERVQNLNKSQQSQARRGKVRMLVTRLSNSTLVIDAAFDGLLEAVTG